MPRTPKSNLLMISSLNLWRLQKAKFYKQICISTVILHTFFFSIFLIRICSSFGSSNEKCPNSDAAGNLLMKLWLVSTFLRGKQTWPHRTGFEIRKSSHWMGSDIFIWDFEGVSLVFQLRIFIQYVLFKEFHALSFLSSS